MKIPRVSPNMPSEPLAYRSARAEVERGTDPGDYYCEHVYYLAGRAASAPGTSVARNTRGEPLIGFLHVPSDPATDGSRSAPPPAERHAATREVVAAALLGFVRATPASERSIRVLLTGFGAFQSIVNNPTGDFVSQQENLDAAMQRAFGRELQTPRGTVVARSTRGYDVEYTLQGGRRIVVRATSLPVDDTALDDRSSWSVQRLYRHFRPHAALHLGVADGAPRYKAEYHADNGGLAGDRHDDLVKATDALPDNFALERALTAASPWSLRRWFFAGR